MAVNEAINVLVENEVYESDIIPTKKAERWRNIIARNEVTFNGAIFGISLIGEEGPLTFNKSIFIKEDIILKSHKQNIRNVFLGNVQSDKSIVMTYDDESSYTVFHNNLYSNMIRLSNSVIYGSVYGTKIKLDNCVVLGGVYAENTLEVTDCVIGTINTGSLTIHEQLSIMHPSLLVNDEFNINDNLNLLLLNREDENKIGDIIPLDACDLTKVKIEDMIQYNIGLGARIFNIAEYEEAFITHVDVLGKKYMMQALNFEDITSEEIEWEQKMLKVNDHLGQLDATHFFQLL